MLDICIMKFRMDSLHYALLAVVVLLVVYAFGSFRESLTPESACKNKCKAGHGRANYMKCRDDCIVQPQSTEHTNVNNAR